MPFLGQNTRWSRPYSIFLGMLVEHQRSSIFTAHRLPNPIPWPQRTAPHNIQGVSYRCAVKASHFAVVHNQAGPGASAPSHAARTSRQDGSQKGVLCMPDESRGSWRKGGLRIRRGPEMGGLRTQIAQQKWVASQQAMK